MMKRPAQRLLLAIGSTLFFLVLGEALARVGYSPQRVVNEGLFEYDRDKVYALRKNLSDGSFGGLPVTTNSLGHRDREIPRAKPRMGFRVLAIGDSITFGHGVHAEETWPEALERELAARFPQRPVDVVNTAVPGNSPFQEYHDLRRALVLQPDAVVIQFVLNDLIEPYKVFRRYGGRGRDYHRVEDVLWWDYELSQRSALFLFIKDVVTRLRLEALTRLGMQTAALEEEAELSWTAAADPPDDPRVVEAWRECLEWIGREVDLSRDRGIPVILLVTPVNFQFLEGLRTYAQERLAAFSRERGIEFVDMLPALRARAVEEISVRHPVAAGVPVAELAGQFPEEWAAVWQRYYLDYDHLTPEGHDLVAETLLPLVQRIAERD